VREMRVKPKGHSEPFVLERRLVGEQKKKKKTKKQKTKTKSKTKQNKTKQKKTPMIVFTF
jgi:hypothetical protein